MKRATVKQRLREVAIWGILIPYRIRTVAYSYSELLGFSLFLRRYCP